MVTNKLLSGIATLVVLAAFGSGIFIFFNSSGQPAPPRPEKEATAKADEPSFEPVITISAVEFVWKIDGGDNPFSHPSGLGIDAAGNIYVVDTNHARIQKIDRDGQLLLMWGSPGSEDGQFDFAAPNSIPLGDVAVDSQGNVYVADRGNARIQKFDSEGRFLAKWGNQSQLSQPFSLAIDSQDNIYVLDEGTFLVYKFDNQGHLLTQWGGIGVRDGEFMTVGYIMADGQDNVYVSDFGSGRIQKFDSQGQFLLKWGMVGSRDGQISLPNGVAVDELGRVFVADSGNYRMQIFDRQGQFLFKWGEIGDGNGQFSGINDIVLDQNGNIYISDERNGNVQKFRLK